jgi:hypothetical protein
VVQKLKLREIGVVASWSGWVQELGAGVGCRNRVQVGVVRSWSGTLQWFGAENGRVRKLEFCDEEKIRVWLHIRLGPNQPQPKHGGGKSEWLGIEVVQELEGWKIGMVQIDVIEQCLFLGISNLSKCFWGFPISE